MKLSQVPEGTLQKVKSFIYGVQAVAVIVAWILTIAILTKAGATGTAIKFYFALVGAEPKIGFHFRPNAYLDVVLYSSIHLLGRFPTLPTNEAICKSIHHRCY